MLSRVLIVLFALSGSSMLGQGTPPWKFLAEYAKQHRTAAGDQAAFARLTQPFAPLDIEVESGGSGEGRQDQARQMKSFFFGIAASTCGISLSQTMAMTDGFHCERCTQSRIDDLRASLPGIEVLVERFDKTSAKLTLLAQWGTPGEYRVNSIFHEKGGTQEYLAEQGVFPGAAGTRFADAGAALKTVGVSETEVKLLVLQMAALHIVALVKTAEGTRALWGGVTRSEAGLLFLANKDVVPKAREEQNGLRLGDFVKIAEGIYYFES
jgi:hypothetical protein